MSHQYANLLSPYDNKGVLGAPELCDSVEEMVTKARQVAEWIKRSKCLMVFTGAGLSTAAGIPDFRGPNGIWTREERFDRSADGNNELRFEDARPTLTHEILVEMERLGYIKFLLTQNVDGLHSRFGFPMDRLAECHGNVFVQRCNRCQKQMFRDTPLLSVGRRPTGEDCKRTSAGRGCRGKLCDFLLDWEDELPEPELSTCYKFAATADLSLCLGTTLQINPVGTMPLLAKKNGGKFVTVNLQKTKHEAKADMAIHGKLDDVMRVIGDELGLTGHKQQEAMPQVVKWNSDNPALTFPSKRRRKQTL